MTLSETLKIWLKETYQNRIKMVDMWIIDFRTQDDFSFRAHYDGYTILATINDDNNYVRQNLGPQTTLLASDPEFFEKLEDYIAIYLIKTPIKV